MNEKSILRALGNVEDQYIKEAEPMKKTMKNLTWQKWAAMAACLCLVVVGVIAVNSRDNAYDYVETVIYNNAEYVVCGEGEAAILEDCGLSAEISADLAGEHIGHLILDEKNQFIITDNKEESQAELFEYAPSPNDNVYILCMEGKYYAAIRRDSSGYHGIS